MVENFRRKVSRNYGTTENSRYSGRSKENFKRTSGKEKKLENLGIPRKVVLFFENFGKYCSFCSWKLPNIPTEPFG